jgi:hypothetical protein
MKTEIKLNDDILKITNKISEEYPELLKYVGEIPVKINYSTIIEINKKNLQDYYDSLNDILRNYTINHKK